MFLTKINFENSEVICSNSRLQGLKNGLCRMQSVNSAGQTFEVLVSHGVLSRDSIHRIELKIENSLFLKLQLCINNALVFCLKCMFTYHVYVPHKLGSRQVNIHL